MDIDTQKAQILDEFMVVVSKCDPEALIRNIEVLKIKYSKLINQSNEKINSK